MEGSRLDETTSSPKRVGRMRKPGRTLIAVGLLPIVGFYALFFIYPIGSAFFISLHRWRLLEIAHPFIGVQNYLRTFADQIFWISLRNTIFFTVSYVVLAMIVGLGLALLIQQLREPYLTILKTVCFIPFITSMVIVSLLFLWMYQPTFGTINYVLGLVGLGPFNWLQSQQLVIPSIVMMTLWKQVGYVMVIFLAGLLHIPFEYYEAARVDGAGKTASFFRITLPCLKPTTLFVVATSMIGSFQVFTQIYVMTKGGPGTASRVLVYHIYETAFGIFDMGRASAVAFVFFLVVMAFTFMQFRAFRGEVI